MGRRLIGCLSLIVVCGALLASAAPALAGTFSWSQPGDVASSAQHGIQAWSYGPGLSFASGFSGNGQTLTGYTDSSVLPTKWIAAPPSGPLQMVPPAGGSVRLTWTSPFASSERVTISGSVNEPNAGHLLCEGTTWSLVSGATTIDDGGVPTISSQQVTVPAGGTIVLTVADQSIVGLNYSTTCDQTNVDLSLSVAGSAPTVSVTSPANGAAVSSESFAGRASTGFGVGSQVAVRVCRGTDNSCPAASAVQTMTAAVQGDGSWSATPTSELGNGTYTVQAEQDDVVGDAGLSAPVTFKLTNPPPPKVTINRLGSAPLPTGTPTLSGSAGIAPGDSPVLVTVYNGSSATGSPVRTLTAPVSSSGTWSVQVTPGLANGRYTAIAGQFIAGGTNLSSSPVTFTIDALLATGQLNIEQPAAGSTVQQSALRFGGSASTAAGAAGTVTVTLWKGETARGKPLGTATAASNGSTWTTTWSHRLALGYYTVQASQATALGTVTTATDTFLLAPTPEVIGGIVSLSRGRVASILIGCNAPAGEVCSGTVLVTTIATYQPVPGGPRGEIPLIYAYVSVSGGQTVVVRRTVSERVWRVLRHGSRVRVIVKALGSRATRTLKFT
jgi:hypothetical protein